MKIAGIDPGFSGAIAILDKKNVVHYLDDMPITAIGKKRELNGVEVRRILSDNGVEHVYIEKSQVMPKQGIVSSGRYMASFGRIIGICEGLQLPYTLVTPQRWKKAMMPDMKREKGSSIVRVLQLYPELSLPRKKDHGKADALLLGLYGLRQGAK